jgi:hypothetical protein
MQKLRPDQVAELVAAYHAGDSTYVLARRYGGKRETVSKHLEQAGVARRGGGARRDPSLSDPAAIREWARQNGYQVTDRGRIPAAVTRAWAKTF